MLVTAPMTVFATLQVTTTAKVVNNSPDSLYPCTSYNSLVSAGTLSDYNESNVINVLWSDELKLQAAPLLTSVVVSSGDTRPVPVPVPPYA